MSTSNSSNSSSSSNSSLNTHAKASRAYKCKNYTSRRCSLLEAKKEYLEEIYDDILEQNGIPQQLAEQEEQIIRRLIFDDAEEKAKPIPSHGLSFLECPSQPRKGVHLGEMKIVIDTFDKVFLEMKHAEKIVEKLRQKYLSSWTQEKKISYGYGVFNTTHGKITFTSSMHCYIN